MWGSGEGSVAALPSGATYERAHFLFLHQNLSCRALRVMPQAGGLSSSNGTREGLGRRRGRKKRKAGKRHCLGPPKSASRNTSVSPKEQPQGEPGPGERRQTRAELNYPACRCKQSAEVFIPHWWPQYHSRTKEWELDQTPQGIVRLTRPDMVGILHAYEVYIAASSLLGGPGPEATLAATIAVWPSQKAETHLLFHACRCEWSYGWEGTNLGFHPQKDNAGMSALGSGQLLEPHWPAQAQLVLEC